MWLWFYGTDKNTRVESSGKLASGSPLNFPGLTHLGMSSVNNTTAIKTQHNQQCQCVFSGGDGKAVSFVTDKLS